LERRNGTSSAVMRELLLSIGVKRELSWKTKLLLYWSIFVATVTYGHKVWVVTERMTSQIQAAENTFLWRVAGLSLRKRVRSSTI